MKPLRQSIGDVDPAVGRAAALLAQLRPTEMTPDVRQRVRAAVRARRSRRASAWRTVFALAVLAILIGTASAWVARYRSRKAGAPAPVAHEQPIPSHVEAAPPTTPPLPSVETPEPSTKTTAPAVATTHPARDESEAGLLVRAMKRLRRDHDPEGAAALLERCARRYPHGILAEETLALRVEAAAGVDAERARALAQQYAARYPNGRFAADVARAIGGAP